MICPFCNTHVSDSSLICPACHSDLSRTGSFKRLSGSYCPNCGALVDATADHCQACGLPLIPEDAAQAHIQQKSNLETSTQEEQSTETSTQSTPTAHSSKDSSSQQALRASLSQLPSTEIEPIEPAQEEETPYIESALPPKDEHREDEVETRRKPTIPSLMLVALVSLALVGGFTLLLWHPWDPYAYVSHNTTERDLSHAGFPGELESLSAQDSQAADPLEYTDAATSTKNSITALYDRLEAAAASLDELTESFDEDAQAQDSDAAARAETLALEISNIIQEIGLINDSEGVFAEDLDHLLTLGNWLRNQVDALRNGWAVLERDGVSEQSLDAAGSEVRVGNAYRQLFTENFEPWKSALVEAD